MNRAAVILLSVSSLPSRYGIGCFSESAYDFVDWLSGAGQRYWQILPLGPTGYGDSPYQSFSTFAGNPYFISLEALIKEGVLTKKECASADFGSDPEQIDYERLYKNRYPLLRKAYERSAISENPEYRQFLSENNWWLSDYALFMAVKDRFGGKPFTEWAEDIRLRWGNALDYYRRELYFDIEFQQYLQFTFYKQWKALKAYANSRGVRIIGDIPIYVAMDSADTWAEDPCLTGALAAAFLQGVQSAGVGGCAGRLAVVNQETDRRTLNRRVESARCRSFTCPRLKLPCGTGSPAPLCAARGS